MSETYTPSEEKIEAAIKASGGDVRRLAIAYLRAQHRARQANAAFDLMGDLNTLTVAAATGDMSLAKKAVDDAERHLFQHRETKD